MQQNAYFLAKIGADTAENERNFAEILPKTGNYPTGSRTPWWRSAKKRSTAGRAASKVAIQPSARMSSAYVAAESLYLGAM